jgi:hypothetical protein
MDSPSEELIATVSAILMIEQVRPFIFNMPDASGGAPAAQALTLTRKASDAGLESGLEPRSEAAREGFAVIRSR